MHDPEAAFQEIQGKLYRSDLNNDQRHFPMLREYEKAKMAMHNDDLENTTGAGSVFRTGDLSSSPFGNF